ncbi:uncharacterized protein LOC125876562 [Solanum stenotomum]|uniref:uncharacterized protein LOC125876562 n=1 Tax=Solanum stenotomum TaxID=172797 RepID=UPI0020D1CFBC|nr:uncharacterized protein LOC125876562 [Solanum stenotomum]
MAKLAKNRGRSRFFNSCYKPVLFNDDTSIIKRNHLYNSTDLSNLKRVRSQEKLDSMLGKDLTKNFRPNRKENAFGRNLSNVLKNVFSDTSLGKKGQRKEPKYSFGSCKRLSSKFEKIFHSTKERKSSSSKDLSKITNRMSTSASMDDFSLFTTSTSSTFSSSSSSSSRSSCSSQRTQFPSFHRSKSANNMQVYDNVKEKEIAQRYNKNVGTYSLLICLLVMVFCGKVFAIICTSTWFYFAPRCFKRIDSDEYKKNDRLLYLVQEKNVTL